MECEKKSTKFKYVKSTFEYLTIEKIPYWIYWPIIGVITYIIFELLIFYFKEKRFSISLLFMTLGIYYWPAAYIYLSRTFNTIMGDLCMIFWRNKEDAVKWYNYHAKRMFTLKTMYSKILLLIFFGLLTSTLLYSGLPFTNNKMNIISLFGFFLITFIGANGIPIVFYNFIILQDIVKLESKIPFFMFQHSGLVKLKRYLFSVISITTIAYFSLIVAFRYSPYGLSFLYMSWVTFLAIFPFGLFFWTLFKFHEIISKSKHDQVKLINNKIQMQLKGLLNGDEKSINNLIKCMDIQQRISSISEWPIDLKSIITLIIALLPLLFQLFTQIKI
ncbi:hypothetical protein KJ830_01800 [bacterium]|nr:hypothetical protein [bacterium]MBU4509760.1 hypothetical protein [bacterium]